jgi:hypothetical protein
MDPDIKAVFQVSLESQARTDKSIGDLTSLLTKHVEASDARFARLEQAIADFTVGGNARMRSIEENLDGLIRAIAREHSNGHAHN